MKFGEFLKRVNEMAVRYSGDLLGMEMDVLTETEGTGQVEQPLGDIARGGIDRNCCRKGLIDMSVQEKLEKYLLDTFNSKDINKIVPKEYFKDGVEWTVNQFMESVKNMAQTIKSQDDQLKEIAMKNYDLNFKIIELEKLLKEKNEMDIQMNPKTKEAVEKATQEFVLNYDKRLFTSGTQFGIDLRTKEILELLRKDGYAVDGSAGAYAGIFADWLEGKLKEME